MTLTLVVLAPVCLVCVLVAFSAPRLDAALAWMLGVVVAVAAGLRGGGFDYDEYLQNIENIIGSSDADWIVRLIAAKDPVFLLIVDAVTMVTASPETIFLVIAVPSVLLKVWASSALPRRRTLFIGLYALMLAPSLEFAAIRAGLALGLLMLTWTTVSRWRSVWLTLALASHASVATALIGRMYAWRPRLMLISSAVLFPIALVILSKLAAEDSRYSTYLENPGTLLAFAMPLATLISMLLLLHAVQCHRPQISRRPNAQTDVRTLWAPLFCIALSVVLARPAVTVSLRVLEIGWVLMLVSLISLPIRQLSRSGRQSAMVAWGIWLLILTVANVLRATWAAMLGLAP